jgi:hypothetical protein
LKIIKKHAITVLLFGLINIQTQTASERQQLSGKYQMLICRFTALADEIRQAIIAVTMVCAGDITALINAIESLLTGECPKQRQVIKIHHD